MRHAYLVLAHNDIPQLRTLVHCLDDSRNDIFIHWDAKSGEVPVIETTQSRLSFLEERIEVNWAGYSMIEAEFALFKKATKNGSYAYYHLLSGADLPIKSQDYIHSVCDRMAGTEFIAFADSTEEEIDYRVQHRFLFSEDFKTRNLVKRFLRASYVKLQDLFGLKRTTAIIKKGSQWCSITQAFANYLLSKEDYVRSIFSYSFCPDELFIQTVCFNSPFMANVKVAASEFDGNMRYIKWKNGRLLPIELSDVPFLKASDKWFARKFSSSNSELTERVISLIQ